MAQSKDYDYLLKMLIIGNSYAGKSSIILRFTDNVFSESMIFEAGIDFKIHRLSLDDKIVKLQIWDTAGQERFGTITPAYYRAVQGIMLIYNIDDRESFKGVNNWLQQIYKVKDKDFAKILIGNKCDLEDKRQVSYDEGKTYADSLGIEFLETSAKDGTNIEKAFLIMANAIKSQVEANKGGENGENGESENIKISVKREPEGKQSGCC